MPCRHLSPYSGREHTVKLIQAGDNDYLMKETRRKPTTGSLGHALLFSTSGMGSFICPVTETWLDIPEDGLKMRRSIKPPLTPTTTIFIGRSPVCIPVVGLKYHVQYTIQICIPTP